jgi:hypothetical protein
MATWAYACRACRGDEIWYVSRLQMEDVLGSARVVRVKTAGGWRCAVVDRRETVTVESMLLREAVASDESDCPECMALLAELATEAESAGTDGAAETTESAGAAEFPGRAESAGAAGTGEVAGVDESDSSEPASRAGETRTRSGPPLQAAAISLAGHQMLVVLVSLDVVQSPGEAAMLADDLQVRFGGVAIVLMGQDEDGTPHYHGDAELVRLLAGVPVDRMPWKVYR